MLRKQKGYVYKKGPSWFVRFTGNIYEQYWHPKTHGFHLRFVKRTQVCKKLDIPGDTPKEVAVRKGREIVDASMELSDFAVAQLAAAEKKYKERIECIYRKEALRELKKLRAVLRTDKLHDAPILLKGEYLTVRPSKGFSRLQSQT